MQDTTEEILNIQRQIFNNKTPQERFLIGNDLINLGRTIVESSIKQQNVNISDIDLKIEVFKRYYSNYFDVKELELIIFAMKKYYSQKK